MASDSTTDFCIASIFLFLQRIHYLQFIKSGYVSQYSLRGCLNKTLDFPLSLPTNIQSWYLYVGLESHHDSTLNYTINSNILEYSIANLSNITCNFDDQCSIPLSHYPSGREICVLASLQADTFVTINYRAISHRYRGFFIAAMTMCSFTGLYLLLAFCSCLYICCRVQHRQEGILKHTL